MPIRALPLTLSPALRRLFVIVFVGFLAWALFRMFECSVQTAFSEGELARLHAAYLVSIGQRSGYDFHPAGRTLEIQALAGMIKLLGPEGMTLIRLRIVCFTLFLLVVLQAAQLAARIFDSRLAGYVFIASVPFVPPLVSSGLRIGTHSLATLGMLVALEALIDFAQRRRRPWKNGALLTAGTLAVLVLAENLVPTLLCLVAAALALLLTQRDRPWLTFGLGLLAVACGLGLWWVLSQASDGAAMLSIRNLRSAPRVLGRIGPIIWFGETLFLNPLLLPLEIAGTLVALGQRDVRVRILGVLAATGLLFDLLVRPPPIGVHVGTVMGLMAAAGLLVCLGTRAQRAMQRFAILSLFGFCLLFGIGHVRLFDWLLEDGNADQLLAIRRVAALTDPGDRIFDGLAAYVFRPHAYSVWTAAPDLLVRGQEPQVPLAQVLGRARCKVVLRDRAVSRLVPADRMFLETHYVRWKLPIWISGARIVASRARASNMVDLVADGTYELDGSPEGAIVLVDGAPHRVGSALDLHAGIHAVRLPNEMKQVDLHLATPKEPAP